MKKIICNFGKKFEIALEENPTTGNSWTPVFRSDELELVDDQFSPVIPPAVGSGVWRKFTFKPKKCGDFDLKIEYKKPWEKRKQQ